MKCRYCVDVQIRIANQNPDSQQGLIELRAAIDKLPEALTAALNGTPYCLYHYMKAEQIFSSPIWRQLKAEQGE